ncbi:MAG: diguanylate cyclase [Spirochaetales bacterium]|nr:diguanylate cyclase [Spirochaetales bacterium]
MNHSKSRQQLFEEALVRFLDTYFIHRDLEGTRAMLNENLTGFGTGMDETAYKRETFEDLLRRDIEEVDSKITYSLQNKKVVLLSENCAVAAYQLNIKGQAQGQDFSLNHLRETLVMTLTKDEKVEIAHLHISFPTDVHEEGESYPLKEIENITQKLENMVNEKTRTIMEAYRELEAAVVTDKLTGLYNRNRIDSLLENEINRANRYNSVFSLIISDIDHFKTINDTYGHLMGDEILVKAAVVFKSLFRNTDFAGRWGGDELVVILPETEAGEAINIAEKLRKSIEQIEFEEGIQITTSLGVAEFKPGDSASDLFQRADRALYQAKNAGRNKAALFG